MSTCVEAAHAGAHEADLPEDEAVGDERARRRPRRLPMRAPAPAMNALGNVLGGHASRAQGWWRRRRRPDGGAWNGNHVDAAVQGCVVWKSTGQLSSGFSVAVFFLRDGWKLSSVGRRAEYRLSMLIANCTQISN